MSIKDYNVDTVRICLICPSCGSSIWIRREEKCFECLSCGDRCELEGMSFEVEPIEYCFE